MRLLRYLVNIAIIGFWIVMMGFLVTKEFLPATVSPLEIRFPEKLPHTQNLGIYANTKRIGYSKVELQEYPSGGYIWEGITELKMPFLEEELPVSIESSVFFDSRARLKDFDIKMLVYNFGLNIEGKVANDALMLLCRTNGSETKYILPWIGDSEIIKGGLFPWFYRPGLKPGDRFHWMVFNPLTQTKELVKAVVERATLYCQKGDFVQVLVVRMWYQNTKMEFWIDENGNPLKVVTPWGWELVAE